MAKQNYVTSFNLLKFSSLFLELWKKFFVRLAGNTNGAHLQFVTKLRDVGHIEVNSLEESEYLLIFCPIVSRVGTDISEALQNAPGRKCGIQMAS